MLSNYEDGPISKLQKGVDIKKSPKREDRLCSQSINLKKRDGLTYIKSSEEISDGPLSSGIKFETKIVKIPTFKLLTSDDDLTKINPLEDSGNVK